MKNNIQLLKIIIQKQNNIHIDKTINQQNNKQLKDISSNNLNEIDNKYTFIIVISKLIISIGNNLSAFLINLGYKVKIITYLSDNDINNENPNNIYIIIWNERKDKKTPKSFIFYQIEQIESIHFNSNYIQKSKLIWEMSIKNYEKYKNIPLNKVFIMPIPFYYEESQNKIYCEIEYDIFFYGTKNLRREKILHELKKKYNIKIGFGISGSERDELIKKSKIIINLSYYNNVSLETTRFNEVFQFNKVIISEYLNNDDYNFKIYDKYVDFIERIDDNLSNLSLLTNKIDYYLTNDLIYLNKVEYIKNNKYIIKNLSEYFIKRNLLSIVKSKIIDIDYNLLEDKIYCLNLPETPIRLKYFMEQSIYLENKDIFKIYPAIKFNPGWQGCAFSYLNLIKNAQKNNLKYITICEDDCCFYNDFIEKYSIIKEFLNKIVKWDLFVGVIANLPDDTLLRNIYEYKGMKFIELNKMNSMVFNIYNNTSYEKILKWKLNETNNYKTIDEYIKICNFTVIVPYPFEFSCLNVDSTIWRGKNFFDQYNNFFETSKNIINRLIKEYLKKNVIKIIN